jgi:hydrogenase maturation protein HypF
VTEEGSTFDAAPILHAIAQDVLAGHTAAQIGRRFHCAVADLILALSLRLRSTGATGAVALSGGVFQNRLLVELTVARLHGAGFHVLTHRLTPPNDGGLALGQLMVANAQNQ